jgi:predicted site-specific integrase-resolvase
MDVIHLAPKQLATRWGISKDSLERWRSQGIGPKFLKIRGQIRYRLTDIKEYEESCLLTVTLKKTG